MIRLPSPTNLPNSLQLPILEGRCPHLQETGETILLDQRDLPGNVPITGLQRTKNDDIFWLIAGNQRLCSECYCLKCNEIFNGAGGNVATHLRRHRQRRLFTQPERNKAFFYFLLTHYVGFSAARDPSIAIFAPDLSYRTLLSLIDDTASKLRTAISDELRGKKISIMIDGWSDMSLRRYLGIVAAYYDIRSNRMVYRFLDLNGSSGRDHSAISQMAVLEQVLGTYRVEHSHVACLCSDSASVNTKLAHDYKVDWMPCLMHLWNLVVKNFVANVPGLDEVLAKINVFRKRSRWVEFLQTVGESRNIAGYCPTRWCTACDAIESLHTLSPFVRQYENRFTKEKLFTDADEQLVVESRNILRLLKETNDLLSTSDSRDGLASVFEVINTIYLALIDKVKAGGVLESACRNAITEIEWRFFCLDSKYCCRILFAGYLNVAHKLPQWLLQKQDLLLSLLVGELEEITATPELSPVESQDQRYRETSTISQMINASPYTSETNSGIFDEVRAFVAARTTYHHSLSFTRFWSQCSKYPHLSQFAEKLRSYPTTTLWVERSFSKARRVLSWHRMRLTTESASRICLLSVNSALTKHVLGLANVAEGEDAEFDQLFTEVDEIFEDQDDNPDQDEPVSV